MKKLISGLAVLMTAATVMVPAIATADALVYDRNNKYQGYTDNKRSDEGIFYNRDNKYTGYFNAKKEIFYNKENKYEGYTKKARDGYTHIFYNKSNKYIGYFDSKKNVFYNKDNKYSGYIDLKKSNRTESDIATGAYILLYLAQ